MIMTAVCRLLLTASFTIRHTLAFALQPSDSPDVVELVIKRRDVPDPVGRDKVRRRRDRTVSQVLDNEVRGCALLKDINDKCIFTYQRNRRCYISAISHLGRRTKACALLLTLEAATYGVTRQTRLFALRPETPAACLAHMIRTFPRHMHIHLQISTFPMQMALEQPGLM